MSGSTGALLVSPCNMEWRSYVLAGDLGCQSFASSWWFFLPNVSPESQQDFCFTEIILSASSLYSSSWIQHTASFKQTCLSWFSLFRWLNYYSGHLTELSNILIFEISAILSDFTLDWYSKYSMENEIFHQNPKISSVRALKFLHSSLCSVVHSKGRRLSVWVFCFVLFFGNTGDQI
jgi:hypothetical protein